MTRANDTFVAAIDAGNTKTVAAVASADGRVRGYARGGSGNIYAGLLSTVALLGAVYREALADAGLAPPDITHLTLSATGADWPEDFADLRRLVLQDNLVTTSAALSVVNDAVGALWAGSPTGQGVAVAAGTSAGTAARRGARVWHSSYWQQTEGAVALGQRGLKAVYLAELGLEQPTRLTHAFLKTLNLETTEDLLHAFTARTPRLGAARAGDLARVLLDEAERGDKVAVRLAEAHGAALGDYALVAARKVGLEGAFLLVLIGGLMRHPGSVLRSALLERIFDEVPGATVQSNNLEPVGGALCASLETTGFYTPNARAQLRDTLPHVTFFAT